LAKPHVPPSGGKAGFHLPAQPRSTLNARTYFFLKIVSAMAHYLQHPLVFNGLKRPKTWRFFGPLPRLPAGIFAPPSSHRQPALKKYPFLRDGARGQRGFSSTPPRLARPPTLPHHLVLVQTRSQGCKGFRDHPSWPASPDVRR